MIHTTRNPDGTTTTIVDDPTPATQPSGQAVRYELVNPTDPDAIAAWNRGEYPAGRAVALAVHAVTHPDPEKD